jgi:hypothetical protein
MTPCRRQLPKHWARCTICGISEVLLAFNIFPVKSISRSLIAADGGIKRRAAAKRLSLGNLYNPTFRHQVIKSPLYRLIGTRLAQIAI